MHRNSAGTSRWLLLIHQIPLKPDYLRVKIWRRLQRIGAVAIKNSVYVLPQSEQAQEDFQWTLREIVEGGGDAYVCEAAFVEGLTDQQVKALLRSARDSDYGAIAEEAREIERGFPPNSHLDARRRGELETRIVRLRKRLADTAAVDFFGSSAREPAQTAVAALEARLRTPQPQARGRQSLPAGKLRGRTWVTRKGIHVDRIGSAWLIARFIDPAAKFKFVPARGYQPGAGEIRFDMFQAEFTHEGDRCTFEVLAERAGLDDPALRPIADIIHDIDLKDGKFKRLETAGVERVITGICKGWKDDHERFARGSALFDNLHRAFGGRSS